MVVFNEKKLIIKSLLLLQAKSEDQSLALGEVGKATAPSDLLMKLARTTPYYKRNRPHVCSFWVKGNIVFSF